MASSERATISWQSQAVEPKTSPVKQWECTRTSGARQPPKAPRTTRTARSAVGTYVTGCWQVAGPSLRINRRKNRGGGVGRTDAGGRAVARVNSFAERGAVRRGVVGRHQRQVQLIGAVFGKGQTNQSAPE